MCSHSQRSAETRSQTLLMRVGDVKRHEWQKSLAVRMLSRVEIYAKELQYDQATSNGIGAHMILTSRYHQVWMPACAQQDSNLVIFSY